MYIRRKVYSNVEGEYTPVEGTYMSDRLFSVTMSEDELALFSDFMDNYYEALYSDDADAYGTLGAGAAGAAGLGAGAYYGGKKLRNLIQGSKKLQELAGAYDAASSDISERRKTIKNTRLSMEKSEEGAKSAKGKSNKVIRDAFKEAVRKDKAAIRAEEKAIEAAKKSRGGMKGLSSSLANRIAATKHGKAIAAGTAAAGGLGAAYGAHKLLSKD